MRRQASAKIPTNPNLLGHSAAPVILGAAVALIYLYFARFGIDPHHDGIMFGAALAQSNGLVPFRDFFAMYGWPISAIQGFAFFVFEPTVLVLRSVSAVMLGAALALLYQSWRSVASVRTANLAFSIAILCTPFGPGILPWNSDLILLLQALLILLARSAVSHVMEPRRSMALLSMSIIVMLILWSRLVVGLVTMLFLCACLILSGKKREARVLTLGFVVSNALVLTVLWRLGALPNFVFQYLTFPRQLFVFERGSSAIVGIVANLVVFAPLVVVVSILLRFKQLDSVASATRSRLFLLALTISVLFLLLLRTQGSVSQDKSKLLPSAILWSAATWSLLLVVVRVIGSLRKRASNSQEAVTLRVQRSVAIAALVQIFPVYDTYHLWWSVVPSIGFVLLDLRKLSTITFGALRGKTILMLAALLLVGVPEWSRGLSQPYVGADEVRITSGSRIDQATEQRLMAPMVFVEHLQDEIGARSVVNVCQNGLFAGLGREFEFVSPYFVSWGSGVGVDLSSPRVQEFIASEQPILTYCNSNVDEESTVRLIRSLGYSLLIPYFCDNPEQMRQLNDAALVVGVSNRDVASKDAALHAGRNICVAIDPALTQDIDS